MSTNFRNYKFFVPTKQLPKTRAYAVHIIDRHKSRRLSSDGVWHTQWFSIQWADIQHRRGRIKEVSEREAMKLASEVKAAT